MTTNSAGIVVIGRNEGERLRRCLESVTGLGLPVVYVDSGSADGSVRLAQSMGADVVDLDLSIPFTAARARNAGADRLETSHPDIKFVQFVDGDCQIVEGWLERGLRELEARPKTAVVVGRLREFDPDTSIYGRLCDIEWDAPVGETKWCGGIAMIRMLPFKEVGRFNSSLVAGEEPELCLRLRQAGWTIERVEAEMALHDGAMVRFRQWWKRAVRAGHASAEGVWLHPWSRESYNRRQVVSAVLWAVVLPLTVAALVWPTSGLSMVLLVLYPLQWVRIERQQRRRGRSPSDSRLYAFFTMLAKSAQLIGMLTYLWSRLAGRRAPLTEFKVR